MGRRLQGWRRVGGVVAVVALGFLGATSYCSSAAVGDQAQSTRSGVKHCGTKTLYGKTLKIAVLGETRSCQKVRRIIRGRCTDGKHWSCFAFRTPGPVLGWFPSKERFARRWSTFVAARRYPCMKATLTHHEWFAPSQRFPTRQQVLSDDLIRCNLLAGMSVADVESLLGEPADSYTSHGHPYRDYEIGPERDSFFQLDSEYLSIKFSSGGIFRKASIYQG